VHNTPARLDDYLQPSRFIDSVHPLIIEQAKAIIATLQSDQEKAIALYYRVRDDIRYNPYILDSRPEAFLASATLQAGEGWCVTKALLLTALCRAAGIPARVGFADVRNHMSTERLRQVMQTNVFYFHGYSSIYLNDRWVKATPAFNIELCEKFDLKPLEFNGLEDSLYHEFDVAGNKHMEYINDRGESLDLPYEEMATLFRQHYPSMFQDHTQTNAALPEGADWDVDVAKEVGLT
jgi:transglutaminase-like putative cysteine protease